MAKSIMYRLLAREELSRVGEINRAERIDLIYEQHGRVLRGRVGDWSSDAWDPDGSGEHSVEAQRLALEHYLDAGGADGAPSGAAGGGGAGRGTGRRPPCPSRGARNGSERRPRNGRGSAR